MNLTKTFAVIPTVAFGSLGLAGSTDQVGLQILFGNRNSRVRFGLSYWNGANTIIQSGTTYNVMKGESAGVNIRILLGSKKNHSLDIYALRRITPTKSDIEAVYGPTLSSNKMGILPAIGYVYRF